MERFELYPFSKISFASKKNYYENDNPKLKTKNIINQNFLEITTFEGVYTVITQLELILFHSLLINYENNGFNPEIYTELEKFKAHLSGKLAIIFITALFVQVNVHGMNKKSLHQATFLSEKNRTFVQIEHHQAHLTYCSNIHPGESWDETFQNLKTHTTQVRKGLTKEPFGIGLRLSHLASLELIKEGKLYNFQAWLKRENMYVFTINGFPYGGFHNQNVKDAVHQPDWSTTDRLTYTKRLFLILSTLLPDGMDGGVSTSPISYRHWHRTYEELNDLKIIACKHFTELICFLKKLKDKTGKKLHLDLEPEPDGVIETSQDFISFFNDYLLVRAIPKIRNQLGIMDSKADEIIRTHFQMCFDVCHFAVGFEKSAEALSKIDNAGINIGRIQISAALGSGNIQNQTDTNWVLL